MPDKNDILKDPGDLLTIQALKDASSTWGAGDCETLAVFFQQLHRHILAGGALPAQWRGEGTAVGALLGEVADFRKAAADWSLDLQQQAVAQLERADDLRRRSSAVTGEV